MNEDSVLVMIVGTGSKDSNDLEPYVNVVSKAIRNAAASNIVLIYSQNDVSKKIVQKVSEQCTEYNIEYCELLHKNMEYDADACFKAFDNLLKKYADKRIILDITHGTKSMSAALYAVGLHYNISDFQYAVKTKDNEGKFVVGAEKIENFDASYGRWQGILKQCRTLFTSCQYAAVKDILSCEKAAINRDGARDCITLSEFCSAWDRFDYKTAWQKLEVLEFSIPEMNYQDDKNVKKMLNTLANGELSENRAIYLMFDLYSNGLRRLQNAQYEDAGVRAYRMAELLGQIHLSRAGYKDSGNMPASDEKVSDFVIAKSLPTNRRSYSFNRTQVISFLEYINYDTNATNFLNKIDESVRDLRNKSILIHGHNAQVDSPKKLEELFQRLIEKTRYFVSEAKFNQIMETAMFLNNNFKVGNNE